MSYADDRHHFDDVLGVEGDPTDPLSSNYDPNYAMNYPDPSTLTQPDPTQAIPQVPMNTPINASPPDDQIVVYDMSRGQPSDGFGSYNYYTSNGSDGMMWHANPGEAADWWAVRGGHGDKQTDKSSLANSSESFGWGPLIGNPNTDFKSLRWDKQASRWFWFIEEAPDWATALMQRQLAMTNASTQAAADAAAAAQAQLDATAQAAQDKADAQALHDQQQAQQAADAAAQVAATAQQTQDNADASVIMKQQDQDDSAQSAVDRQAQLAQLQIDKQQAQIDLQNQQAQDAINAKAAQAQLDWETAHPDQFYAQQNASSQQANATDDGSGIPPADPSQGQAGDEADPFADGSDIVPASDFA